MSSKVNIAIHPLISALTQCSSSGAPCLSRCNSWSAACFKRNAPGEKPSKFTMFIHICPNMPILGKAVCRTAFHRPTWRPEAPDSSRLKSASIHDCQHMSTWDIWWPLVTAVNVAYPFGSLLCCFWVNPAFTSSWFALSSRFFLSKTRDDLWAWFCERSWFASAKLGPSSVVLSQLQFLIGSRQMRVLLKNASNCSWNNQWHRWQLTEQWTMKHWQCKHQTTCWLFKHRPEQLHISLSLSLSQTLCLSRRQNR